MAPGAPSSLARSLAIERLTFGPDALAHDDGQVVFVPLAAPGDVVRARVVAERRGYLRATIDDVVTPGASRVAPTCPAFGRCGGCQWQHVALAAQRTAKRAVVIEQLARLGGLHDVPVDPIDGPPAGLAYRSRITLVVDGRRLGYHRMHSHVLEEVAACELARPAVAAHLATARRWVATLRTTLRRVTIAEAPDGVVLVGRAAAAIRPPDVATTETLLAATPSVRGAVLVGPTARLVVGDPNVRVAVAPDLALEMPADAFTQVNPEANLLLVESVLALGRFAPQSRVLDLYCGAGNLGLPLARSGVRVHGIERAPVAIEAARANAARLRLPATFTLADVRAGLAAVSAPVDGVVLDPPRAGAGDVLPALARLRAPRIVYVSCDPATLARDVRRLVADGYTLGRVRPLDLFPQTFHVESVAVLELT